jgi:signal transduction histidine kinase
VLDNLIGNAIKFTDKGMVTIRTESLDGKVKVSVTDTGIGISEHNQTRLFKKFEQAGENMLARQVNQSTGLGLYISKLIIKALHGTIALEESTLGKGSTFSFTLPAALPDFPI